ncbi:hypothetical protein SELMODRAFT_446674 [Selaginella moellendorffii]|uniref:BAHD family acyltransferase n=1 Tax=Selaginella moellendorffii TaxID=88036 RepID=D8STF6_SELML|nr:hypothetical protein SELMODRAFT_446674 [Selaginella moellendorffii]
MVFVKRSTLVRPASPVLNGFGEFPYRNRLLFFRPPSQPLSKIITHMKQSLAAALSEFYPVAGRISVREDMRMQLECNNHGVMFSEASCDRTLPEGDKFDLDPEFLLELSQAPGHEKDLKQCYTFKVTEFSCGGFCVAMKYSHELMDGTSFWHFIQSWAEVSCGKPISQPPFVVPFPIGIPSSDAPPPPVPSGGMLTLLDRNAPDPGLFGYKSFPRTRRFRFGKLMIQALKQRNPEYSTFQLLSSHIWWKVCLARGLGDKDTTKLFFAVNCRGRFPHLPKEYLGTPAAWAMASAKCGEMESLGMISSLIKKTIREFSEESWGVSAGFLEHYAGGESSDKAVLDMRPDKDLYIGSSFYFPVFHEFSWGTPCEMAMAQAPANGRMYYFPGKEKGSVDLYITLQHQAMDKLENDASFCDMQAS